MIIYVFTCVGGISASGTYIYASTQAQDIKALENQQVLLSEVEEYPSIAGPCKVVKCLHCFH